jgi:hypothetical protein
VFLLAFLATGAPALCGPPALAEFTYSQEPAFGFCPELGAVYRARIALFEEPWGEAEYLFQAFVLDLGVPGEDQCLDGVASPFECVRETMLPPRFLSAGEVSELVATWTEVRGTALPDPDPRCGMPGPCVVHVATWNGERLSDSPCDAPRMSAPGVRLLRGLLEGLRRGDVSLANGDVNGDVRHDAGDVVYLLAWLFTGGPEPLPARCSPPPGCPPQDAIVRDNGDINGDGARNISDAVYLLRWLFLGAPAPAAACSCRSRGDCEWCEAPARCVPAAPDFSVCTSHLTRCEDIEAVYQYFVEDFGSVCVPNEGCHAVLGGCAAGLGGCNHAVNTRVAQADIYALARRYRELDCSRFVCECIGPPSGVRCVAGRCELPEGF